MPSPLALAATFDPRLALAYGKVVGNEAASKGNEVIFGPDVNIMRDPRGGRTFEAFGEDPYVAARTDVGWIEGLQSQHVIADVKHFMANNEENGRTTSNSIVDERAMHEIYMPAFEAAVKEASTGTVMAAYNMVNGTYMTENGPLLNGVLKHDWGFPGFVLTDYNAQHSTIAAANGGTDLELPYHMFYDRRLLAAGVASGQISPATIDDHVRRILRTLFAFGVFDHPEWWKPRPIDLRANGLVARRIEQGAIVLLRNRASVLPLRARRLHSIAVIGADATVDRSGGGSSKIAADHTVSPLQAIITRAGRRVRVSYDDGSNPARAAAVAARSDVALVFAYDTEGEGNDKQCIALECSSSDPNQDGLIARVAAANRRTIVVLTTGSPVLTPWVNRVAGIIEAWYPGEEGGTALASVLFGDADPGGRLPVTFPVHAGDVPAHTPAQWPGTGGNGLPSPLGDASFMQIHYSESVLVGYRWYDAQHIRPAFPFGFGLSYTRWRYARLTVRGRLVSFTVRNVGRRAGSDVAQLYVGVPALVPGLPQPPRQLKRFAKVRLRAGAAQRVSFVLDDRSFAAWSTTSHTWVVRPGCYRVYVGRSSRDLLLHGTVAVGGARCHR
jgi:beta-glucosidase